MYFNLDYARSRGLELEYKKRAGSFFVGDITTSYSIATGKSSSPKDELLVARGQLEERSIKENYLSWDRPLRIALDLNLFAGKKDHHNLFGLTAAVRLGYLSARISYNPADATQLTPESSAGRTRSVHSQQQKPLLGNLAKLALGRFQFQEALPNQRDEAVFISSR